MCVCQGRQVQVCCCCGCCNEEGRGEGDDNGGDKSHAKEDEWGREARRKIEGKEEEGVCIWEWKEGSISRV